VATRQQRCHKAIDQTNVRSICTTPTSVELNRLSPTIAAP
jgi:hypothetical protein